MWSEKIQLQKLVLGYKIKKELFLVKFEKYEINDIKEKYAGPYRKK